MSKNIPEILCSIGLAMAVGGVFVFYYGCHGYSSCLPNTSITGGVIVTIGVALAVFGWLMQKK